MQTKNKIAKVKQINRKELVYKYFLKIDQYIKYMKCSIVQYKLTESNLFAYY